MAYDKQEWRNKDKSTPLSARRLLHIEDGIESAHEAVEGLPTPEDGKDGKSAYEIAVDNDFDGSESDWLDSLKGKDGKDGSDADNPFTPDEVSALKALVADGDDDD